MPDEFASLSKEGLDLLNHMLTLPDPSTVSERALFNSRMRYSDSIIAKMKILTGERAAEIIEGI